MGRDLPRRPSPRAGPTVWLIGLLGVGAALLCATLAVVLRPEVGLFGDPNSSPERAIGLLCAIATGPALLAGLLAAGIRRRDPSMIVPAVILAACTSAAVTLGTA